MIVKFSKQDLSECKQAASLRWQLARAANVANQRQDKARTDDQIDYLGIKGELAVAKVFQIDHDIHKGGIDPNIDMWCCDTSIDVKTTFTQGGHLLFKNKESFKADVAILVTALNDSEDMYVSGWCTRKEFIENAPTVYLKQKGNPAFHCTELRKIEELWKFLTMKRVQNLPNKI